MTVSLKPTRMKEIAIKTHESEWSCRENPLKYMKLSLKPIEIHELAILKHIKTLEKSWKNMKMVKTHEELQFSAPFYFRHFRLGTHFLSVRLSTRYQAGHSAVALAAVVDVTFLGSREDRRGLCGNIMDYSWWIFWTWLVNDGFH